MDFIRIITAVLCYLLPAQIQAAPQWNQWNQNYGSGSSATNINCGQPGSCLGVGIGSAIAGIASAIKSGQSNSTKINFQPIETPMYHLQQFFWLKVPTQKDRTKNLIIYRPTVSALCTFLIHTAVLQKYDHCWTLQRSFWSQTFHEISNRDSWLLI